MEDNLYFSDLLRQPEALRIAIHSFNEALLENLARSLEDGDFDRVILTGMGASFYGAYPASLRMARTGLPVIWQDASELLHNAPELISPRTLLWVVSQSGYSAEILALLELARHSPPAFLLATCNDLESPLGQGASLTIPLQAEPEKTASTRTYLNTLALTQLAAARLVGETLDRRVEELLRTADSIERYLGDWQLHLARLADMLGAPRYLALLGRGDSLASAKVGALILQEAAKFPAMGMQAAEFRHGPMEIAREEVTVLLFAGSPETLHLNQRLALDLVDCQAKVLWVGPHLDGVPGLPMPAASGIALPLAEFIPIQLLSLHLAHMTGFEPGKFLHVGKVTEFE